MLRNFPFYAFIFFFSLATNASTTDLVVAPEIIVTGKRLRSDHRSARIITEEELDREAGRPIGEILRETPGVDFIQGTAGNSNVLIRGSSGSQTLVIIDGVKVNDPSVSNRYFDWSRIDPTRIERVEILKGPQAVSYGSDAIGGVILIRTKYGGRGETGVTTTAGLEAGSESFLRAHASAGASLGEFFNGNHILRISSVGKSVSNSGSTALSAGGGVLEGDNLAEGSVGAEIGSTWSGAVRSRTAFELRASREDIDAGPFDDDSNSTARSREIRTSTVIDGHFQNGTGWAALASHQDIRRAYADHRDPAHPCFPGFPCESDAIYRGSTSRVEGTVRSREGQPVEWTSGVELSRETVNVDSYLAPNVLVKNRTEMAALFAESSVPLNSTRTVSADFGSRFSKFSDFGNNWSGKAGMNFHPNQWIEFDTGVSTGFKAPSLYSLYDPIYGNQTLKPEESVQIEAGASIRITQATVLSLRGFGNRTRNRFGYEGPPFFRSLNVARAEVIGAEFGLESRVAGRWQFSPTVTYMRSEDLASRRELTDIPKWKSTLKLSYDINPGSSITASFIGKSGRESSAPGQRVAGFFRADLTSRHSLSRSFSLTTRFENVLNRKYQEIRGYRMAGVSAYLGLEFVQN